MMRGGECKSARTRFGVPRFDLGSGNKLVRWGALGIPHMAASLVQTRLDELNVAFQLEALPSAR